MYMAGVVLCGIDSRKWKNNTDAAAVPCDYGDVITLLQRDRRWGTKFSHTHTHKYKK